ncbi:hypothetical protein [Halomontanus rarus]|uniref:hypothetical protein n=1 Tax=Halomontanus rarus TaxID=3034020 RepID=UPI0023E7AE81|nr:hypothetical protein [Halovivax sp. TS33]
MIRRDYLGTISVIPTLLTIGCLNDGSEEEDGLRGESNNNSEEDEKESDSNNDSGGESGECESCDSNQEFSPSGIIINNFTRNEVEMLVTVKYGSDHQVVLDEKVHVSGNDTESIDVSRQGKYKIVAKTEQYEESYEWKAESQSDLVIEYVDDGIEFTSGGP